MRLFDITSKVEIIFAKRTGVDVSRSRSDQRFDLELSAAKKGQI